LHAILTVGDREIYRVGKTEYDVNLLAIGMGSTAKFRVNGEILDTLEQGDGTKLADGSIFFVTEVHQISKDIEKPLAAFLIVNSN